MRTEDETKGGPYEGWAAGFFGVVARPRTWLGFVYHWLAFPLGLAYFVFLVVALSVGISLTIVMIGIPLLVLTVLLWRLLARFERLQARGLLGARVPSGPALWRGDEGLWQNVKTLVGGGTTWMDFVFLVLKFPVGIVSFVLCVTGLSIVVAFIGAPFMQEFGWFTIAGERVDSWPLALALVPVGILALFVWLHVLNLWGYVSARLAEALLVDEPEKRAEVAAAQPPAPPAPQAQAPVPPWQAAAAALAAAALWQQAALAAAALATAGSTAAAAPPQAASQPPQPWPPQAPQQPWPQQQPWQQPWGPRPWPPQPWQQQPWQQAWGPSPWPPQAPNAAAAAAGTAAAAAPQTPQAPEQPPAEAEAGPAANEPSDDN